MKICYEQKRFNTSSRDIIEKADDIINEYIAQGFSLTLRQLYYQFVSRAYLDNTEQNYKRLGSIISDARRAGLIDWKAIEDRTRFVRSNSFWSSPKSILKAARDSYRRDLWENQPTRLEVWIEKDALIGVIDDICRDNDIPYFSCRGYVSDSEIWSAANRIVSNENKDQNTIIIHLGDHDPSGIDMTRDINDRLELFTRGGLFSIERVALNMDQIETLNPPPNPAKINDSRYDSYVDKYGPESWELDALEPAYIIELIEDAIQRHRDENLHNEAHDRQETERQILSELITNL